MLRTHGVVISAALALAFSAASSGVLAVRYPEVAEHAPLRLTTLAADVLFAIPCGACFGLFGVLGWLHQPLNLFHLLGAFLGVCLTHNYSIFSATSAYRREPPPVSVRMSALTTATSFCVLALSGIPVVRALGLTVALMVAVALAVIELEHLSALGRGGSAKRQGPSAKEAPSSKPAKNERPA